MVLGIKEKYDSLSVEQDGILGINTISSCGIHL